MKIILKYILNNGKERKLRTAVMLLSILLSAALLFVSLSTGASYESAQRKMARGMSGSAAVSVSAAKRPSDSEASCGAVTLDDIPDLPTIRAAAGILKGTALYRKDGYYESVDLIASSPGGLEQINPPRLSDGGEITDFDGSRIILPDRFTSKFGINQGDTITLLIGGNSFDFEVAGIAAYDTVFLRKTRGTTALLPLSTLAGILGQTDGYSEILIEPAEGVSGGTLKKILSAMLPESGYRVAETVNEALIEADVKQKSVPFFLISFFSLTMCVFIIYSSYKVITLERLQVIGTFRSIGARRKTVTGILLLESAVFGCAGGLSGIPVGILALKITLHGMGNSLAQGIEIPTVITPFSIIFSFAAAAAVTLCGAYIPIRAACRLPIRDVVLDAVKEKRRSIRLTAPAGAVLLIISVLLPRIASGKMLYPAGAFSLLGLIASAVLVIPLLTDFISACLERPYGFLFGNTGRLAVRNLRGNKNTGQNITLLFISISAVIAISAVGDFVTSYVADVFKGARLQGFAEGKMNREFVDKVKNFEGMEEILPVYLFESQIKGGGELFARVEAADDLELYGSLLALHYSEKSMEAQAVSAFETGRAILVNESVINRRGLAVGDTLTLSKGTVQADYKIAGSFQSRASKADAIIPAACAVSDFGADAYGFLAYTAVEPDAAIIQIRDLFGETGNWSRTTEEFNGDALSTVGAFLKPMHSMTYFILLLASAGIVNNLLINCIQKRRITAMYRSVGLSSRQNLKMILLEGFTSGFIGSSVAVLISSLEISTIFLVAGPKLSITPEMNPAVFLTAGAVGILITVIGSAVPAVKTGRMKLAEEIKAE